MKTALRSKNVLTPDGMKDAAIVIEDGIIRDVLKYPVDIEFENTDYGELIIMPGLIDTHVHINEPGRTDWEGFETATKSAAAGGITMLVDMPLNSSPVTTTVENFNKKTEDAKNKLYVDCGFYGGLIPGNISELEGLIRNGVFGLKAFMVDSGIEEFPFVNENDLRKALSIISGSEIPLLVHAEIDCGFEKINGYDEFSYDSFLSKHPDEWEIKAIELLIKLCREFNFHIHIVHLSSSEAIELIREAKKEGLKLTVETCPHYLIFSSDDISSNDTRFKCTPPIRNKANREKLWTAVKEGVIDFIVSDHSPCDPDLKCREEGNFEKAWGGISGLQLGLSAVWTEARKRGFTVEDVSRLMSRNTASFIGLENSAGKIEKGFEANLTVFDPDNRFMVKEENLFHKHKLTPYSGMELFGTVEATYLRGKMIFNNGEIISAPSGEIKKSLNIYGS